MSISSDQSNAAQSLVAIRLLRVCIKSLHLSNDTKAHFTYLRLMHQLGHYDEFHAQVLCCCADYHMYCHYVLIQRVTVCMLWFIATDRQIANTRSKSIPLNLRYLNSNLTDAICS